MRTLWRRWVYPSPTADSRPSSPAMQAAPCGTSASRSPRTSRSRHHLTMLSFVMHMASLCSCCSALFHRPFPSQRFTIWDIMLKLQQQEQENCEKMAMAALPLPLARTNPHVVAVSPVSDSLVLGSPFGWADLGDSALRLPCHRRRQRWVWFGCLGGPCPVQFFFGERWTVRELPAEGSGGTRGVASAVTAVTQRKFKYAVCPLHLTSH
jgi:hypothetical protein